MPDQPGPWEAQTLEQIADLESIVDYLATELAESPLSEGAKRFVASGWRKQLDEDRARLPIAIAMDQREAPHA